jgi:hypothetical protein
VLFKEHYIEVPEEKYDVIGELEAQTVELTSQMDDIMSENVQLKQQVVEMKRLAVIEEMSKDLAATDASRLAKLLEGVQFEDEQLYREKVSVIVENFISKPSVNETVTSTAQPLVEDVAHAAPAAMDDSIVNQYAQALSRTIKKK